MGVIKKKTKKKKVSGYRCKTRVWGQGFSILEVQGSGFRVYSLRLTDLGLSVIKNKREEGKQMEGFGYARCSGMG